MRATELDHVVFYVRSLEASRRFYRDLLGLQVVGSMGGKAAGLVGEARRIHHEVLLIEVGDAPGPPAGRRRGLYHIGIRVGVSLDALRGARLELEAAGVRIDGASDHFVGWTLYLADPDGNEVEVYCDHPEGDWRTRPQAVMAPIRPLRL
ncbi:MAG: VOC family protein [Thermoplasmatota archaeon]